MNKVKTFISFQHISFLIDHLHFPDLILKLYVFDMSNFPYTGQYGIHSIQEQWRGHRI